MKGLRERERETVRQKRKRFTSSLLELSSATVWWTVDRGPWTVDMVVSNIPLAHNAMTNEALGMKFFISTAVQKGQL